MADIDKNIKKEDVKVYRFKFTPEIMNLLHEFAQTHKYDEKEVYKEEWDKWTKVNNEIIQKEENRLLDLGWNGKIKDKMFKSAKYYFRNKTNIEKEPKKRKKYTRVTNDLRITIDRHIPQCIINNDKPSDGLNKFYEIYNELIENEYSLLKKIGFSKEVVDEKIKKTYKNFYFQIIKKIKK